MIRLVGSLLTLARADAGQITIARDRVDLSDLVSTTVKHVRPLADRKELTLSIEPGPIAILEADEDLLLQLLLSLLDNALKYTPPRGEVSVGWRADASEIELRVRDTGVGIPGEHLSHILDHFYRVDSARNRVDGGSGTGPVHLPLDCGSPRRLYLRRKRPWPRVDVHRDAALLRWLDGQQAEDESKMVSKGQPVNIPAGREPFLTDPSWQLHVGILDLHKA